MDNRIVFKFDLAAHGRKFANYVTIETREWICRASRLVIYFSENDKSRGDYAWNITTRYLYAADKITASIAQLGNQHSIVIMFLERFRVDGLPCRTFRWHRKYVTQQQFQFSGKFFQLLKTETRKSKNISKQSLQNAGQSPSKIRQQKK